MIQCPTLKRGRQFGHFVKWFLKNDPEWATQVDESLVMERLEALSDLIWDALPAQWEKGFFHLKQFSEREGHCRVPTRYKTDDSYRLGSWVNNQRTVKGTMKPDRRQRLEALPGWVWDARSDQWEEGFFHLKQFSKREGHCRVPTFYKCNDSYRLGSWVSRQRRSKGSMEPDRRKRLKALPGWIWKVEKSHFA